MKKIACLFVCAAMLASCNNGGSSNDKLKLENDSLISVLNQNNAELDEMMATFNQVSESLREINRIEGRVDIQRSAVEGSGDAKTKIAADIESIKEKMAENKAQIAKLQGLLKKSKYQSLELKKAIESLSQQLAEKARNIEELQAELAAKNIRIQELDQAVSELTTENADKAATVAAQDRQLNTAWFVFGTKKELKNQNILTNTGLFKKGQVMKSGDVNLDYFTKIDIRTTKEIMLYSKKASILTTHPAGSYQLEKNGKGEMVLKITNPEEFWSVSKYLVIQVN